MMSVHRKKSAKTSKVLLIGWLIAGVDIRILRPKAKSQKVVPKYRKMCAISYEQYMVLKRGYGSYICSSYIKKRAPISYTCYIASVKYRASAYTETLFAENNLNFHFFGNLLLRESAYHIVNCLKSFDFLLFFAYSLKLLRGSLDHLHIIFALS